MNIAQSILGFFGLHRVAPPRNMLTVAEPVGEVDNLRERFSAARFIEHLRAVHNGDKRGRGEWSRYILGLSEDDARLFWGDFDALVNAGALVHVLTPDEQAEARQRVLDKWEDYHEMAKGAPLEIPIPEMHAVMADPLHEVVMDDDMDDAEVEVWAEDIEDADIGEGNGEEEGDDDEDQVEFEIEVGDEPEEGR